jgi:predicted phosphodiesterase
MKIKGIGPIIRGRKRFNAFFKSLLPTNNYYGEEDNNLLDFPLVHKFDNHFFIGLDSLAEGSGVFANGNLGYSQLDELEETLSDIRSEHSDAKIIIYLHNNPFKFGFKYEKMKLLDAKKFLKIITGVDVLLFGHLHRNKRYVEEEQKYDINCIQLTGASTFPRSESYKVEWIELDTELSTTTSIKY